MQGGHGAAWLRGLVAGGLSAAAAGVRDYPWSFVAPTVSPSLITPRPTILIKPMWAENVGCTALFWSLDRFALEDLTKSLDTTCLQDLKIDMASILAHAFSIAHIISSWNDLRARGIEPAGG